MVGQMTNKPLLLDLFCCAGGAAMGYWRAGFEVVGVDVEMQPNYPFRFLRADWEFGFDLLAKKAAAVHASPPCQAYSDLAKRNENADDWPKLIEPVREALQTLDVPWVIENVEGAPLIDPAVLCGVMFPPLRVLRHRLFEANFQLEVPEHGPHPLVFTHDKRKAHYGKLDQNVSFVQVTGGGNSTMANARDAMGIDWMKTKHELNEAIPPAYTEWVGAQMQSLISGREAA
jgi:DNA (cytosine-5)-methyltransferase 1